MANYPFSQEEMQKALSTNVIEYAMQKGFKMKTATAISYHIEGFSGLHVFERGFYCFGDDSKGGILKFAEQYLELKGAEAIADILGIMPYTNTKEVEFFPTRFEKPKEDLVLPERDNSIKEVATYLIKERCLDRDIVKDLFEQGLIMQVKTQNKGYTFKNCAFVSYDFENKEKPMFCALRSIGDTKFTQDVKNSSKAFGFKMQGESNRLFVFEAPIDAISHASLYKMNKIDYKADSRLSVGGLSDKALDKFLEHNPNIEEIIFCFDNDYNKEKNVGQEYAQKCCVKYEKQGFKVMVQKPELNDFNEVLQYVKKSVKSKISTYKKTIETSDTQNKEKNKSKEGR